MIDQFPTGQNPQNLVVPVVLHKLIILKEVGADSALSPPPEKWLIMHIVAMFVFCFEGIYGIMPLQLNCISIAF